ncbi:protein-tyrosine phosphatase-like protein [Dactylonectria estremocensis]|uniref:Protein-tyrosine phosphatase-like protein n=1 Tax=Dactylonectria estremocensis TaxID=1079267 RepID=A0A9P9JBP4_9HYPO|nr:protein-tyrosine phosphatase-like protein [Dactylonectria estremocensis]
MADLGPPFIHIPGLPNFRDVGKTPIADRPGHSIRPGIVFRAAEPSRVTDAGIAALQALRISHVYDLRSAVEIQRHSAGIREWDGASRVFVPVFQDEDYGPEAIALRFVQYSQTGTEGFVDTYRSIWEAGTGPVATVLNHLASPDASPLLVHCTAGKDRTGVVCAIILSLCGVDDETIAQEYSLTEIGLAERKEEIRASLMKNPALKDDPDGADRMLGARPENMIAALQAMRRDHGSPEQYVLTKCGVSQDAIEQLRKNLIVADATD